MLSKCANQGCSAPFLYFHRGQLYRWETAVAREKGPSFGADPEIKRPLRRVEFFWLCEDCVKLVTLVCKKGVGITTLPLAPVAEQISEFVSAHESIKLSNAVLPREVRLRARAAAL